MEERQAAFTRKSSRATRRARSQGTLRFGIVWWGLSFLALLLAWEQLVILLQVPEIVVPRPSLVAVSLWVNIADGTYFFDLLTTLQEVLVGFVIGSGLGFGLALLIGEFGWARALLYPYVIGLQSIPKAALAPMLLVWFGFGMTSKIILVVLSAMLPTLVNTLAGLQRIDRDQLDLMRAYCAARGPLFMRVKLPSCLPMMFAGLEVAVVTSLISAVVSEFLGSRSGLGYRIMVFNSNLDMAGEFSALIVLALLGFFLHWLVHVIGRRVIFWGGER